MNAIPVRERRKPDFPAVVFNYTDALQALATAEAPMDAPALAEATQRVPSNMKRDVHKLLDAGVIETAGTGFALSAKGRQWLAGIAVAEGATPTAAGAPAAGGDGLRTLRHDQITLGDFNPRKDFTSEEALEAMEALRASIVGRGLKQPIEVRPTATSQVFELVAGERRYRAIGAAIADGDLPTDWPIKCVVEWLDDAQAEEDALVENLLRRDLHPLEEAAAYARLSDRGREDQAIADLAGRSKKHVQDYLRLHRELPDADKARMRLPKWDADRLTLRQARFSLQEHKPSPADAADPIPAAETQTDVEEAAPRSVFLTPSQALILLELQAACRLRPAKKFSGQGHATEPRFYPPISTEPDLAKLFGEGFLTVSNYPHVAALTPAGAAWLARMPGAFMEDEYRLASARTEAGLEPEEPGRFSTQWLDIPPPPPPIELTDAEELLLLEIYDSWVAEKQPYYGARVRHDYDRDGTTGLFDQGVVIHGQYSDHEGAWRIRPSEVGMRALATRCAKYANEKARAERLEVLRTKERRWPSESEQHIYVTEWLNAPFPLDVADQAKADERAKDKNERERAGAEKAALIAAHHAAIDDFESMAADMQPAARSDTLRALLDSLGGPAPWSPPKATDWKVNAWASNGTAISRTSAAANRLALIALNMAAGIDPKEWPASAPGAEKPLTREAFLSAMAARLLSELEIEPGAAASQSAAHLDAWLGEEALSFGDDNYTWLKGDAEELADQIIDAEQPAAEGEDA